MWPSRREFGVLAIIGILMLGCGNTAVLWSELYLSTGLAALLVAGHPALRRADRDVVAQRRRPARPWMDRRRYSASSAWPFWFRRASATVFMATSRQIVATAVILIGSFCWTAGSVISRRSTIRISGFAAAGWQMLFGGIFNTVVMMFAGRLSRLALGTGGMVLHPLPRNLRLAVWLYSLHLPAQPCSRLQGHDLRLHQSGDRHHPRRDLPSRALRHRGVRRNGIDPACRVSNDEFEAEDRRCFRPRSRTSPSAARPEKVTDDSLPVNYRFIKRSNFFCHPMENEALWLCFGSTLPLDSARCFPSSIRSVRRWYFSDW